MQCSKLVKGNNTDIRIGDEIIGIKHLLAGKMDEEDVQTQVVKEDAQTKLLKALVGSVKMKKILDKINKRISGDGKLSFKTVLLTLFYLLIIGTYEYFKDDLDEPNYN